MARAPAPAPAPARVEVEVKVVMGSAVVMPCPPRSDGGARDRGARLGLRGGAGGRGARSEERVVVERRARLLFEGGRIGARGSQEGEVG